MALRWRIAWALVAVACLVASADAVLQRGHVREQRRIIAELESLDGWVACRAEQDATRRLLFLVLYSEGTVPRSILRENTTASGVMDDMSLLLTRTTVSASRFPKNRRK